MSQTTEKDFEIHVEYVLLGQSGDGFQIKLKSV